MDLISSTNLSLMESIIETVCPVLKEKINQFKAMQGKLVNLYTDPTAVVQVRQKDKLKQGEQGTDMKNSAEREW